MNKLKQRSRPFARKSKYRDAKLIVIATEGELTEPFYFEALALDERFRNPRVKTKVLPTIDGRSAPNHVIRRLDDIRRKHGFYEGDELWLVIDKVIGKAACLAKLRSLQIRRAIALLIAIRVLKFG